MRASSSRPTRPTSISRSACASRPPRGSSTAPRRRRSETPIRTPTRTNATNLAKGGLIKFPRKGPSTTSPKTRFGQAIVTPPTAPSPMRATTRKPAPSRRSGATRSGPTTTGSLDYDNETVPPALFAIDPPAPSWLYDNDAISRGYLDDACDGFVEVRLAHPGEKAETSALKATARICSAPPAMAPDSLFVRTLADDLDQAIFGAGDCRGRVDAVTRARAQDIVRRAFETVRFMNVAVMNGNDYRGRSALSLDSMPEEEAADTERAIRPVMHPGTVDTRAVTALHQQAYAALRAGTAPWFTAAAAQPERSRRLHRPRPAQDAGADVRRRQQLSCADLAPDPHDQEGRVRSAPLGAGCRRGRIRCRCRRAISPAHRHAAIHYEAKRESNQLAPDHLGRQLLSRPRGRLPRRLAEDVQGDRAARARQPRCARRPRRPAPAIDGALKAEREPPERLRPSGASPAAHRSGHGIPARLTSTPIKGPAPSDPDGYILLTTDMNPDGLAPLEWSNALAYVLPHAGDRGAVRLHQGRACGNSNGPADRS